MSVPILKQTGCHPQSIGRHPGVKFSISICTGFRVLNGRRDALLSKKFQPSLAFSSVTSSAVSPMESR